MPARTPSAARAPHTESPRARFYRAVLRFWAAAGLLGLLLGASLRVCADAGCPLFASRAAATAARPYTPGPLALANLSAQLDGQRAALARQPRSRELRASVVGLLLSRARFTGSVSDLDAALALAEGAAAQSTRGPRADDRLLEASTLAALHRFPEALLRLDAAAALGAPADVVQRERDTITLAIGAAPAALEAIVARRAQQARTRGSVQARVDYAAALAVTGRLREADEWLARAQRTSPDVSPLPVALIAFQRGVLAAEHRGDDAAGEAHYREALRLVPGFLRASVHLAELEAERGEVDAARGRLRALLDAEDPEPASRLAALLPAAERAPVLDAAARGYARLLTRHRAAYLDHALEFALAHAPADAAPLAAELVAARPTPRSYLLAIDAAEARGDRAALAALAGAAEPLAGTHPLLAARLAALGLP